MGVARERALDEAFQKGVKAQRAGAPMSDNPYSQKDERRLSWAYGYMAAESKRRTHNDD